MNKDNYIEDLRERLKDLTEQDIEDAIYFCEEYFMEAGEGNEEQVINELGTPAKFAAQIRAEATIKYSSKKRSDKKNTSLKSAMIIFMGICSLPIAFPVALTVLLLIFTFGLLIFVLAFSAFVSFGAILIAGIPMIIQSFLLISTPANAMITLGAALLSIGTGLILFILFYMCVKLLIPAYTKLVSALYNKVKGVKLYEKV